MGRAGTQDLLRKLGDVAKICGEFKRQLREEGFTAEEAMELISILFRSMIKTDACASGGDTE